MLFGRGKQPVAARITEIQFLPMQPETFFYQVTLPAPQLYSEPTRLLITGIMILFLLCTIQPETLSGQGAREGQEMILGILPKLMPREMFIYQGNLEARQLFLELTR